jgi:hypothetical protein
MKNRLSDVRDHLVVMLEMLAEKDVSEAELKKAQIGALVADKYIAAVKVEIEGRKLMAEHGDRAGEIAALAEPKLIGRSQ